jgi:alpha-1,2-mannosyltransferase
MELEKRFPRWAVFCTGCAIIFGYLAFVASVLASGYESARRGGSPVFTDFTPRYAASLLLQNEPAANLYVPERMFQAEIAAAQAAYDGTLNAQQAQSIGFAPWMYPPVFIIALYPLALLPYLLSLAAWLLVTAIPYLAAIASAVRDRSAWLIAFASPPAFYNIMYGQTGFLSGGLIGLGLSQLYARPVLAGICIGLASFKPHFGILLPLALVVGGHWKPFGIATITVVGMIVVSIFAFGMDPWYGLIGTAELLNQGFQVGAYDWAAMVSVLGMGRLAGIDLGIAWKLQALTAVAAAAAVIWAWRQQRAEPAYLGLQIAVVCTATLLAVPLAYCYDLVLLVPAIAWIWADMRQRGASMRQLALLGLTTVAILPLKMIAGTIHFQYGPLLSLVYLLIAMARLQSLRRQTNHVTTVAQAGMPVQPAIS